MCFFQFNFADVTLSNFYNITVLLKSLHAVVTIILIIVISIQYYNISYYNYNYLFIIYSICRYKRLLENVAYIYKLY